jgi:hypothetical protein
VLEFAPALARIDGSVVLLILGFVFLIGVAIRAILIRNELAAADKALAEKRFAAAAALFLRVARAEFYFRGGRKGTAKFDRAVAGLEDVYLAAGRRADFARLRGLHADLAALRANKKYRSVDALRDSLSVDGWKIRTCIGSEAMAFLDNLPALKD